jgi:hypothetical protein
MQYLHFGPFRKYACGVLTFLYEDHTLNAILCILGHTTNQAIVLTTYLTNLATLLITYPTNLIIRFRVEAHKLIEVFHKCIVINLK